MSHTFLYFAYGSNMLSRRLMARTPSALAVGTGFVEGRRLVFDKVSRDGSGKADIEVSSLVSDRVYGVLYQISTDEERALDRAEGFGSGYRKDQVQVLTAIGDCSALSYVATKKKSSLRPYHWYKAMIIAGATEHHLPAPYIGRLHQVSSQPDPNPVRRAENEATIEDIGPNGRELK